MLFCESTMDIVLSAAMDRLIKYPYNVLSYNNRNDGLRRENYSVQVLVVDRWIASVTA